MLVVGSFDPLNRKGFETMTITKMLFIRGDRGGRRLGIDRRCFPYDAHIPERRYLDDRRCGEDRRNAEDRRAGEDRRRGIGADAPPERRIALDRRTGMERRAAFL
jgi:hypothetical protein